MKNPESFLDWLKETAKVSGIGFLTPDLGVAIIWFWIIRSAGYFLLDLSKIWREDQREEKRHSIEMELLCNKENRMQEMHDLEIKRIQLELANSPESQIHLPCPVKIDQSTDGDSPN